MIRPTPMAMHPATQLPMRRSILPSWHFHRCNTGISVPRPELITPMCPRVRAAGQLYRQHRPIFQRIENHGEARPSLSASLQIQVFDFFARPRCSAQKFETGFDAGVVGEAAHGDRFCHRGPARLLGKLGDHHFQSHAIKMLAPDTQSSTRQPTNT